MGEEPTRTVVDNKTGLDVYVIGGLTLTAGSVDIGDVKLLNIAGAEINPAKEDGNLLSIKTKTDNIPSDPAKESGKLTSIDSTLTSIKGKTDNIFTLADLETYLTSTGIKVASGTLTVVVDESTLAKDTSITQIQSTKGSTKANNVAIIDGSGTQITSFGGSFPTGADKLALDKTFSDIITGGKLKVANDVPAITGFATETGGNLASIKTDADTIAKLATQQGTLVDSAKTYTFAASEALNTGKDIYFAGTAGYPEKHKISISNESIENDLTVTIKNWVVSEGEYSTLTQLNIPAQIARTNPTQIQIDDGTGSFSTAATNLTNFTNVTVNDVTVPGHVRANEALYIGSLTPFNKVYFNLGTASTDVCTLVYEYYNGSQWVALTNVTDNTVAFTATAGVYSLKFKAPSDWAKVVVNAGTSSYFIRVRCSAFTSAGTQGLITQGIMTLTANSDRFTRIIRGLVETDFKVIVQNATAGVAASQSIGGAGAFSGSIAVMRMI